MVRQHWDVVFRAAKTSAKTSARGEDVGRAKTSAEDVGGEDVGHEEDVGRRKTSARGRRRPEEDVGQRKTSGRRQGRRRPGQKTSGRRPGRRQEDVGQKTSARPEDVGQEDVGGEDVGQAPSKSLQEKLAMHIRQGHLRRLGQSLGMGSVRPCSANHADLGTLSAWPVRICVRIRYGSGTDPWPYGSV